MGSSNQILCFGYVSEEFQSSTVTVVRSGDVGCNNIYGRYSGGMGGGDVLYHISAQII